jgi:hypothetical protein
MSDAGEQEMRSGLNTSLQIPLVILSEHPNFLHTTDLSLNARCSAGSQDLTFHGTILPKTKVTPRNHHPPRAVCTLLCFQFACPKGHCYTGIQNHAKGNPRHLVSLAFVWTFRQKLSVSLASRVQDTVSNCCNWPFTLI